MRSLDRKRFVFEAERDVVVLGGGGTAIVVGGVGGISIGIERDVGVDVALTWLCGSGSSSFLGFVLTLSSVPGGCCCSFKLPVEAKTLGG